MTGRLELPGGALVDLDVGVVRTADGKSTELRPKTARLLQALASRPGQLVTKDELLSEVWPGLVVDEDALVQCVGEIRRALGVEGKTVLRTHSKRGYSLQVADPSYESRKRSLRAIRPSRLAAVASIATILIAIAVATALVAARAPAPGNVEQAITSTKRIEDPVVAVFPFEPLTPGARWERLARALTEDVIADLAHNSWLFVLADATTSGRSDGNPRDAARALGAAFLVTGAIQVEGERARVTAALTDVSTGRQLWSKRFEGPTRDLLMLQREASEALVGELGSNWTGPIASTIGARARDRGIDNLDAYELFMLAADRTHSYRQDDLAAAAEMLERVVQMAPEFGEAWAKLSLTIYNMVTPDMSQAEKERMWQKGHAAALEAYRVSPDAPYAIGQAANVVRWDDPQEAERMILRAASLAPNNADILAYLSFRAVHFPALGPEAEKWIQRAVRLNPDHPSWYDWNRAAVMMVVGRYDEAAEAYARAPRHLEAKAGRIAALALAGDGIRAKAELADLLLEAPAFTISWHRDATGLHPDVADIYARGFRIVGAPD